MKEAVQVIVPHQWQSDEAYSSGRTAYRLKINPSDNPSLFGGGYLYERWLKGYNQAASEDTFSTRRVVYEEERPERNDSHNRRNSRTNVWRPGKAPRERASR